MNREVEAQLSHLSLDNKIKPGQTVACTIGSRRIANIPDFDKHAYTADHVVVVNRVKPHTCLGKDQRELHPQQRDERRFSC